MPQASEFRTEVEYVRYHALFGWSALVGVVAGTFGLRWLARQATTAGWVDVTILIGGLVLALPMLFSACMWTVSWFYVTQGWRFRRDR